MRNTNGTIMFLSVSQDLHMDNNVGVYSSHDWVMW